MKNVLVLSGIGLLIASVFGKKKINEVQEIVANIKPKLNRLNSININSGSLVANVDIDLINQTDLGFNTNSGNSINLRKFEFFDENNKKLLEVVKELNNVSIEPRGTTTITNVEINTTIVDAGFVLYNIFINKLDTIIIKTHANILGKDVII